MIKSSRQIKSDYNSELDFYLTKYIKEFSATEEDLERLSDFRRKRTTELRKENPTIDVQNNPELDALGMLYQDLAEQLYHGKNPAVWNSRKQIKSADCEIMSRDEVESIVYDNLTFSNKVGYVDEVEFIDGSVGTICWLDSDGDEIEVCGYEHKKPIHKMCKKSLKERNDEIESSRKVVKSGKNNSSKEVILDLIDACKNSPFPENKLPFGDLYRRLIQFMIRFENDRDEDDVRHDYGTKTTGEWIDILRSLLNENIESSHQIKSAVDGGWEVRSSDVPEALDLFVEYFGEETALEEIAKAMGDYTLRENLEWIAQQFGIAEDLEDSDTWDMYDEMLEIMGVSELFTNLTQAAGYDELAEDLAFIFRMNDFREWDKYD